MYLCVGSLRLVASKQAFSGDGSAVAVSADGALIVIGGYSGEVVAWNWVIDAKPNHVRLETAKIAHCSSSVASTAAKAQGGALFTRWATFDIVSSSFLGNAASEGSAVFHESAPDQDMVATISSSQFRGNSGSSHVRSIAAIAWHCKLGQWSLLTGDSSGDFDGCPFKCASGFYGNQSSHNAATCAGACITGHYCPEGTSIPNPCPRGFTMPAAGAASEESCLPCAPGAFQPVEGKSTCLPCPPGTFSSSVGSFVCEPCPPGGFCASEGAASVRQTFSPCAPGTYNPLNGSSSNGSCVLCPVGTANPIPGSDHPDVCVDCLPGSFAGGPGHSKCHLCPVGGYQDAYGATACADCPSGYYCPLGSSTPRPWCAVPIACCNLNF